MKRQAVACLEDAFVDFPIRMETKTNSQAVSVTEFKNISVNPGITKAFLSVK